MYPADNNEIIDNLVRDMSELEIDFVGKMLKKHETIKIYIDNFVFS